MKHEFSNTAPILRLVFAIAALSVSLSIGGWIDFLATVMPRRQICCTARC